MNTKLAIKYLTDSADKNEKIAFEEWLALSDANRKKYEDFISGWEKSETGLKTFHPNAQIAWNKFASKVQLNTDENSIDKKKFFITYWRSIAAAAVILLASGIFLLHQTGIISRQISYTTYTTQDSVKSVILDDGSKIMLNKYTELRVAQWRKKDKRTVYLKGEAFFEITHDPKRPFLVHTEHTTTRVLGTTFNLSTLENKDVVSLINGKIEFFANGNENESTILASGEMANYNHQLQQLEQSQYPDKNFMAWKTGELNFKDTPLPKVLDEISSFYNLSCSGNISGHERYTLTANFRKQPIEKLISVLELTWNAHITFASDTLYLNFNQKD